MLNPEEEGMGPLERGRKRYHQKDYSGALEAFTEAVNVSTGYLQLNALDHRAATHEKMNNLQHGLRDSKKMIDLKPQLSKGYLRCAKVLQLKGEKDLALKIYERGLAKVKFGTDDERTLLQSMFNKLQKAQDPGKTLDPLQFLPLELAELMAQNLSMRDRVICLRVSRPWKRLLESSHKLWTTLDTTSAQKPVTLHALKTYLRRSNYTLDKATISSKAHFDAKRWDYLTKTCKNLHFLVVNGAGVIGTSLTDALPLASNLTSITVSRNCEIFVSTIGKILRTCQKTLTEAAFLCVKGSGVQAQWPKLESLQSLDLRTRDNCMLTPGLPDVVPNIKSLTLVGWAFIQIDLSPCNSLENVSLVDVGLDTIPHLPMNIRHLDLSRNPRLVNTGYDHEREPYEFPLLEMLSCSGTDLTGETIKEITSSSIKKGNLRSLHLGDRCADPLSGEGEREISVKDQYPASNSLKELSISGSNRRDGVVIAIVNLYPNLERLDVSRTKITGVAVKHFVSMGIKWLKLDECSDISPDAVDYARGKNVEVEFNFPSRRIMGFRDRVASAF